jgi:hypothetical protein
VLLDLIILSIMVASGAGHAASPLGELAPLTPTNPQMNPHKIGGSMRVKLLSPRKPAYLPASLVSPASHDLAATHGEPYLCPAAAHGEPYLCPAPCPRRRCPLPRRRCLLTLPPLQHPNPWIGVQQ